MQNSQRMVFWDGVFGKAKKRNASLVQDITKFQFNYNLNKFTKL
jgi:hypothetical protein